MRLSKGPISNVLLHEVLSKGQQRGNLFAGYVFHMSIFMKALADVNVPAECIRNDKHLELLELF